MPARRKLSDAEVAAIRTEYDPSMISPREMAVRYGISKGYLHNLILERNRKSVSMSDDVGSACSVECREGMSEGHPMPGDDRPVQSGPRPTHRHEGVRWPTNPALR